MDCFRTAAGHTRTETADHIVHRRLEGVAAAEEEADQILDCRMETVVRTVVEPHRSMAMEAVDHSLMAMGHQKS